MSYIIFPDGTKAEINYRNHKWVSEDKDLAEFLNLRFPPDPSPANPGFGAEVHGVVEMLGGTPYFDKDDGSTPGAIH
jgi:hypothetical protein